MKNITGPPVIDDNFFGRKTEYEYVWRKLQDGNNFIFPSPRRVGKTSFALKLIDIAKKNDWKTIHINLEQYSELEAMENLTKELIKLSTIDTILDKGRKILDLINRFKPSFNLAGVDISLSWEKQQKEVYTQIESLLDHTQPTLIFFDELTVLLGKIIKQENGKENVAEFLHWLRGLRITPASQIRWIYCSSVGIENFTHTHNISATLNDTTGYLLKSFDAPTSTAMLKKLAADQNISLPNDVIEHIIEKLDDCIPFFLQIVFEKIDLLHSVHGAALDTTIAEKAYNEILEEDHFNTWIERLGEQYGDINENAFLMLHHICQEHTGTTRESLTNLLSVKTEDPEKVQETLTRLLYMLQNDGYLMVETNRYRFRSPLLRDFWFKRYVQ